MRRFLCTFVFYMSLNVVVIRNQFVILWHSVTKVMGSPRR